MFRTSIKLALRSILKHKGYSFINIAGLSIGIACCLIIILFVSHELSFDNFNINAENIYRVGLKYHVSSNRFDVAQGPFPTGEAMVAEYPEVLAATRIYNTNFRGINTYVKNGDKQFKEEKFLWADQDFFKVFSVDFIDGDELTALANPNTLVLTPASAKKYFGRTDVIGEFLKISDGSIYEITAVVNDFPANSHFHFDFLASINSLPKYRLAEWYDIAAYTYVLLDKNADPNNLEKKLPDFSKKYIAPVLEQVMGVPYDKFILAGNYFGFFLEPLLKIHLHSTLENEFPGRGNINTVYIFIVIAIIILSVASINYVNLATARAMKRSMEIGVRKALGSNRKQIVLQLLTESLVLSFVAICIAVFAVNLIIPWFNSSLLVKIPIAPIFEWQFLLSAIFMVFVTGIVAGGYPALFLSSFSPVQILRGNFIAALKGNKFRNILVVFQFTAAIGLIVSTLVILNQVEYFRNKDLGFEKDRLIVIHGANKLGKQQKAFKNILSENSDLISSAYTDSLPQMLLEIKTFKKGQTGSNQNYTVFSMYTDYDFLDTYKIKLNDGRFFDKKYSTDSTAVILNKAALKEMGITDYLNEQIILTGINEKRLNIIGVFEDFHVESLHQEIKPVAAILKGERLGKLLSVRVAPGKINSAVSYLEQKWSEFVPGQPFQYEFFDNKFDKIYRSEVQAGSLISTFAFWAILISAIGLFGLASFIIEQRTREIGIRKVLGAKVSGIAILIAGDFLKLVLCAVFFAWPISYYFMEKWLDNFSYRIELKAEYFLIAAVIAFLVAGTAICFNTIKAALANPVKSIKYE